MSELKDFGIYLAKIRERSGFRSQRQLALAAGVSPATLSRVEDGSQKIQPDTLRKIAPFLKDVTYDELMKKAGYLGDGMINESSAVYETDPDIQFIMRARKDLSPKAYERFMKLARDMKKSFEDEED